MTEPRPYPPAYAGPGADSEDPAGTGSHATRHEEEHAGGRASQHEPGGCLGDDSETPMPTGGSERPTADIAVDLSELHLRFDQLEAAVKATSGTVERNYEQSLIALRDRALAAETGITQTVIRPIARQLASLIDRVELEQARRQADPWALTASLVDELLDVLEDLGVETIDCMPGMEVDKARHRVARTTAERASPDESLLVVARMRHGYEHSGYVLRPAEVAAEWSLIVDSH